MYVCMYVEKMTLHAYALISQKPMFYQSIKRRERVAHWLFCYIYISVS